MTAGALVAATGATLVALVVLRALVHKAAAFAEFTGVLADYRIVPERLVVPAAAALVAAEAAAVALIAIPATTRAGAVLAATLLVLYGAAMAANLARGRRTVDCGCGGPPQILSPALLARNAALAGVAVLVAVLAGPAALSVSGAVAAVAGGLVLFLMTAVAEQVIANDGHIGLTP